MTTENTPRPEDEARASEDAAQTAEPQDDSLEMPEPSPVIAEDGEVVAVHDDLVATGEAAPEATAGTAARLPQPTPVDGAVLEEEGVADLADDEGLDVESLREASATERSWDYTHGPLEQVGPVQPTPAPRDEAPDVLERDGREDDAVRTAALSPTTLRRRSLFSTGDGTQDEAAATTTTLATGTGTVDETERTSALPVTGAGEDVAPTSTFPTQTGSERPSGNEPGVGAAGAVTVGSAAATAAGQSAQDPQRPSRAERPRDEDDVILDGSTVVGKPASRAAAHWAGVLLSIVLLPAAWFLLHMGSAALSDPLQPYAFGLDTRGALELGAGALVLAIALWTARRSSVGSFLMGLLTLAVGVAALALPARANETVSPFLTRLADHSTLGHDLATYFWTDVTTGRLAVLGLALLLVGVVSHSSRRAGRREQEVIDRVRRVS